MRKVFFILALSAVALISCNRAKQQNTAGNISTQSTGVNTPAPMGMSDTTGNMGKGANGMGMMITSSAFTDSASIPSKYTCDGQDVSPPLAWSGVPDNARTLALIMDDPDAPNGTWTHWVIWNIPNTASSLPEGVSKTASVSGGGMQGQNSWPKTGYGGPCPPPGKAHRYNFTLFALDTTLSIPDKSNAAALRAAMNGHILAQAKTIGMYAKGGKAS